MSDAQHPDAARAAQTVAEAVLLCRAAAWHIACSLDAAVTCRFPDALAESTYVICYTRLVTRQHFFLQEWVVGVIDDLLERADLAIDEARAAITIKPGAGLLVRAQPCLSATL